MCNGKLGKLNPFLHHWLVVGISTAYSEIFREYEHSFHGFLTTADQRLPTGGQGRGQRSKPTDRAPKLPLLKPSRPGEVSQSSEFLGRTPQRWFLQLRRIQSLVHGLRAESEEPTAQQYRAELWGAILKGKGFHQGFSTWWNRAQTCLLARKPHRFARGSAHTAHSVGHFSGL